MKSQYHRRSKSRRGAERGIILTVGPVAVRARQDSSELAGGWCVQGSGIHCRREVGFTVTEKNNSKVLRTGSKSL